MDGILDLLNSVSGPVTATCDDQSKPNMRLTYRWKTNKATTKAIVADIWDRDAAV
jgi:hypothetical protein